MATLIDVQDSLKAATCADTKLGTTTCQCDVIGLGAGLGWRLTITCGADVFTWWDPPAWAGAGVQGPTSVNCADVQKDIRNTLERLDRERAKLVPVPPQSWKWPASFFFDSAGVPLHTSPTTPTDSADWIEDFCSPVQGPPYTLQPGDIVLFSGNRPGDPSGKISHSAIATGRGDEISHMWWTRAIQEHMIKNGRKPSGLFKPEANDPSAKMGGYVITRDSLAAIEKRFTVGPNGYLTNAYTVWRITDPKQANFDELRGCAAMSATVAPTTPGPAPSPAVP